MPVIRLANFQRASAPPAPAIFRFTLPAALLACAPRGEWPGAPHGASLHVGLTGDVRVTCRNFSETYARARVQTAAAAFLRAISADAPMMTIAAELVPGNGDAPIQFSVSLGARVVIARTAEAPALF